MHGMILKKILSSVWWSDFFIIFLSQTCANGWFVTFYPCKKIKFTPINILNMVVNVICKESRKDELVIYVIKKNSSCGVHAIFALKVIKKNEKWRFFRHNDFVKWWKFRHWCFWALSDGISATFRELLLLAKP